MKRYTTPRLHPMGSIVELTQGSFMGFNDPDGTTAKSPCGSVGFEL